MTNRQIPLRVPARVRVKRRIRGDTTIRPGDYDCDCNKYGAVRVVAENGKILGLKPDEFETLEWRENKKAK